MKRIFLYPFFYLFSFISFSQTLSPTGNLNVPRAYGQSQILTDGRILFFGGYNGNESQIINYKSSEIYDPVTGIWSNTGDMNKERRDFSSVVLNDGRIMAIGGQNKLYGYAYSSCEIYNPITGTWIYADSMNFSKVGHEAVRLKDGRVLVVGGKVCETYDPARDEWELTGELNEQRGNQSTITVLNDGRVLVVGSDMWQSKTAEIYDPFIGSWTYVSSTMNAIRHNPQAVLLNDGKVLIFGSITLNDQETAEIFDPITNTFTVTSSLAEGRVSNPAIKLDNGEVLVFGLGDIFSATDTKCIEVFNPVSGTWRSNLSFIRGTQGYSINKLNNGLILISGGAELAGNSGSQKCYLVDQNLSGSCIMPNLSLQVSGENICTGKNALINIINSESGVKYQAMIGDQAVGAAQMGGGNMTLSISSENMIEGNNIIRVQTIKNGCSNYILNDTANVFVKNPGLPKPVISYNGSTAICSGASLELSAPSGAVGYLWSTGETTGKINVSQAGVYKVKVKNNEGCYSNFSNPVSVSIISPTINVGTNQTVCENIPSFMIYATPGGGIWSGSGISSEGLFNPATSGAGVYTITYSICNTSKSKTITVNPLPAIVGFSSSWDRDTICTSYRGNMRVFNSIVGQSYQLKDALNNNVSVDVNGTGGTLDFYTENYNTAGAFIFSVVTSKTNSCGARTISVKDTLVVLADPGSIGMITKDTICAGEIPIIKTGKTLSDMKYRLSIDFSPASPYMRGNGDSMIFEGNIRNQGGSVLYRIEATNLKECYNVVAAQQYVIIDKIIPDFVLSSEANLVGDNIQITNRTASGDNFSWFFGSSASIDKSQLKNPLSFTYNSSGEKEIKLVVSSKLGCKDSLSKKVHILNPVPRGKFVQCQEELFDGNYTITDYYLDKNKNSYITGYLGDQMFAIKADSLGKLLWHIKDVAWGYSYGTGITSDNDGNAYIVGNYAKYMQIGDLLVYGSNNNPQYFIVKINNEGIRQWMFQGRTKNSNNDYVLGADIICDNSNRIFAAGIKQGSTVDFISVSGTRTLVWEENKNHFLVELNTSGELKDYVDFGRRQTAFDYSSIAAYWANGQSDSKTAVGANPKLAFDNEGNVLVSGNYDSYNNMISFELGNFKFNSNGTYVAKYSKTTGWKNAFKVAGHGVRFVQSICVDQNDAIYTSGYAFSELSIGDDTLELEYDSGDYYSDKNTYSYITKYLPNGNLVWYTNSKYSIVRDMEISKNNTLIAASYIKKIGGVNSSNGESFGIKSVGDLDILLTEFSADGNVISANNFGSPKMEMPFYIEKDGCGDIYMCALKNRNSFIRNNASIIYGEDFGVSGVPYSVGDVTISKLATDGYCTKANCQAVIIDTLDFDAKIASIFPDSVISSGNQNIEASIKNLGKEEISNMIINYQIDNLTSQTYTWNGTIVPGASATVSLLDYNFLPGTHTIKVWIDKINSEEDENHLNDTLMVQIYVCDQGLSGTYTIGKTYSDFNSFSVAVEALKHCGVNGPVVFNVEDGIYEEQVYIPSILNASAQNTITFKSASEDSSKVILTTQNNKLSNNYLLKLSGADYFIFKQMTFKSECKSLESTIIELDNGSDYNKFINNQILGLKTSLNKYKQILFLSPVNSIPSDENELTGNLFNNGEYGILYWDKSSRYANKNIIQQNKFRDQNKSAIFIVNQDNVLIADNDIETTDNQSDFTGVYISHNFSLNSFGKILRNLIKYKGGFKATAISVNELDRGVLIANNYVRINSSASLLNATEAVISCNEADYVKLYYNTVMLNGTYSANCFSLKTSTYADVKNNIFVNLAGGRSFYIDDVYLSLDYIKGWDYNNLYTTGSILGASKFLNLNSFPSIENWVSVTGFDQHSYSINLDGLISDQGYTDAPELNGKGIFINEILDDIQGQQRNVTNPDIGADEFDPILVDALIDSISYPYKTLCEGPQAIILRVRNNSVTASLKNITIYSKIGKDTIKYIYTGNILPNSISEFINVGVYNFKNSNPLTVKYWTSLPNGSPDFNSTNDTIEYNYFVQGRSLNLPSDLTMCPGENLILDAGKEGEEILWSTGESSNTITISKVGNYTVTVKTNSGCIISDTVRVEAPIPALKMNILFSSKVHVSVAIPDLNSDRFLDIAASSISGSSWFNYVPETKSFIGTGINNGYDSHTFASWADFDNNGEEDVLFSRPNDVGIAFNNGGQFVVQRVYDDFSGVLTSFDFNKDRYVDALINGRIFIGTEFGLTKTEIFYTEIDEACLPGDYDNDGDQDMLTYGSTFTNIFNNNGSTLVDVTLGAIGLNIPQGYPQTASWGDFNNDGWMDLFIGTNKMDYLFKNNGDGTFSRVFDSGEFTDDTKNAYCSSWGDFDNDGYIDLFVGNFSYTPDPNETYPNTLYKNNKDGSFSIVKMPSMSSGSLGPWSTYGAAWGDLENDGDLDLAVSSGYFQNEGNCNNWINIKLIGTKSNRAAIGAKVYVYSKIAGKDEIQVREIAGLTGKFSQNSLVASFGLGDAALIDSIIVKWPSGIKSVLKNILVKQVLTITEEKPITALLEKESEEIIIYPNPGTGKYNLNFSAVKQNQLNIQVYNMIGERVFEKLCDSGNEFIDITDLESGIYIFKIIVDKKEYFRKIIKN